VISSPPPPPSTDLAAGATLEQLSTLQALLALAMAMNEVSDVDKIAHLVDTSAPSLGHAEFRGVHFLHGEWVGTSGSASDLGVRLALEKRFADLGSTNGPLNLPGDEWAWAFPLRSLEGDFGYLLVAASTAPDANEQFILRVLAQQTGIALANARAHQRERLNAIQLRAANAALAETVDALERNNAIHDRLTRVSVAGEGQEGIARAVHELTGYSVAVEDRYGNLRAWAGPDPPEVYPKDSPSARERLLTRAKSLGQPMRDRGRLLAIAQPTQDVTGVLLLIDPDETTGELEHVALEHGATVLAVELSRLHTLGETELRLRRDLTDDLLDGTDARGALARAEALGYDIERTHRAVVVSGISGSVTMDALFDAVRRTARDQRAGSLLVRRGGCVVLLSDADTHWESFRTGVLVQLQVPHCRVGVGGRCERPVDLPRSYSEAQFALVMQGGPGNVDQALCFDDLGVYRILAGVPDTAGIESFVMEWLGKLLSYDTDRKTDLVFTLSRYLECGGNYDQTSRELSVHRSTLKYRLQRIREISGHELSDPDTSFNLQLACRAWQTLQAVRST
jgi:sugar diacid utilization regulator